MLLRNPAASRNAYPAEFARILSIRGATESREWLRCWDGLHAGSTPLRSMSGLARRLNVGGIHVKDESVRSDLGSFKALGAPIALVRLILRLWKDRGLDAGDVFRGVHKNLLSGFTVISATDGNHGRALAAAARSVGCRCVIVLHAHVSVEREAAIAAYGADIVRIEGNYDASVTEAARLAAVHGWHVVSDTSYDGYEDIPRDVMQGYGVIAAEIIEQAAAQPEHPAFTHVFLQAGVGGMAAGIASYFWEFHGAQRPCFIVTEPAQADCLFQSAIQGRAAHATGTVDSLMAGLACGETSPLAWRILAPCIDAFQTISDDQAVQAVKLLAEGSDGDIPIVSGESGAAGLAGLLGLAENKEWAETVGLNRDSQILLISTEGATAPSVYASVAGQSAGAVLARQQAFLAAIAA
ncbi:diaminopropionate ammonia-lyase [Oxalobacteraceae bacterium OM1]|nr:diaminopropionate ammonia-lyase [Oxalobacteraceae bacterium OM1]